jgi:trk system potassium uptake protein TrkH
MLGFRARRRVDDREEFTATKRRHSYIVAPTVHVVGLSVLFLVPGLFFALLIEWGSSTSHDEWALVLGMVVALVLGISLWYPTSVGDGLSARSVFSAVAFSWIACSFVGSLPYVAGSMFSWSRFDDALFEAVSGFSATGSTVLADIERNGAGILMWRQITQYYGGMGMVVLAVTVLPVLGVGGLSLMSAEAPGLSTDRLAPRVNETARMLWKLYLGITFAVAMLLWLAPGPNLYDSVAHAFTTASTGGFSTYNSSIGHFDSWLVESIVVVGLFVCGINFTLHHRALRGDVKSYFRSADTRLYLYIMGGAIVFVTALNWMQDVRDTQGNLIESGFTASLRDAIFNVVTLGTSGGFGNARGSDSLGNYVLWSPPLQLVLLLLMVIGGSAGSTSGGAKVFRIQVAFNYAVRSVKRLRHPSGIIPVKLGNAPVPTDNVHRIIGFLTTFLAITLIGTLLVTATGAPFEEAVSASISAMSNMGPALGDAGPTSNFLVFSRPARGVLMVLMMIGRLELFAVLLMFATPAASLRNLFSSKPPSATSRRG